MKAAPNREPEIIAKVSTGDITPASKSDKEVAATGDPDNSTLEANQPKPKALAGLSTDILFRIIGAKGMAPSFIKAKAKIKAAKLIKNKIK